MRKNLLFTIGIGLGSLMLFWLPFLMRVDNFWGIEFGRRGMDTIVANFDGLNFLVVSRTWYQPERIEAFNQSFLTGNDPVYFTAHYPGYALVVAFFDLFLSGPNALLSSVIFSSVILSVGLYMFFSSLVSKRHAVFLSTLALFLPARMLSVRAVGSTEPLFIALVLLSLVASGKKRDWLAGVLGALAVLVRSPGILLFVAYGLFFILERRRTIGDFFQKLAPYLLMPLTLVGLWVVYGQRLGSFWAYFQAGDTIHLFFPPFQIFSTTQSWVSGMWLDDIVYLYLLFAVGAVLLWKRLKGRTRALGWFAWVYLATVAFIAHRDVARYSLPMAPLVLAGYEQALVKPWMKWLLVVLLIPTYLAGWNFVLQNVQPVNDWSAFL